MRKRPPFPYRKDGRRGRETYLQGADEVEAEPFAQARRLPKQRFGEVCGGRKLSPHQPLRGSFPPGGSHWQNSRCRPPPNAFPAQESSNMPWYSW